MNWLSWLWILGYSWITSWRGGEGGGGCQDYYMHVMSWNKQIQRVIRRSRVGEEGQIEDALPSCEWPIRESFGTMNEDEEREEFNKVATPSNSKDDTRIRQDFQTVLSSSVCDWIRICWLQTVILNLPHARFSRVLCRKLYSIIIVSPSPLIISSVPWLLSILTWIYCEKYEPIDPSDMTWWGGEGCWSPNRSEIQESWSNSNTKTFSLSLSSHKYDSPSVTMKYCFLLHINSHPDIFFNSGCPKGTRWKEPRPRNGEWWRQLIPNVKINTNVSLMWNSFGSGLLILVFPVIVVGRMVDLWRNLRSVFSRIMMNHLINILEKDDNLHESTKKEREKDAKH